MEVICNSSEYVVLFFYKVLLDVHLMCMYSEITYERLNNNVDRCINRDGFHNINKWFRTAVTKSFKISSFQKEHMKSKLSCHFLELLVHHFQIRTQLSQDYWMKENVIPKSTNSELLNKRKCSSQLVFLNFRVQADR